MIPYLVFGVSYAFAAAVQPGPFQAFVVARTLVRGRRRALPVAFAPLVSDIPVLMIVLTVLRVVPERLIHGLRIGGGLLLLWLAFGAWRAWRDAAAEDGVSEPAAPDSDRRTFLQAVGVNILGPGPWLGWSLIMGPLFLEGWREAPAHGVALIVSFYVTMVATLVAMIVLVDRARRLGPRVVRTSLVVSAIALAGFGVWQLVKGIAGLMS